MARTARTDGSRETMWSLTCAAHAASAARARGGQELRRVCADGNAVVSDDDPRDAGEVRGRRDTERVGGRHDGDDGRGGQRQRLRDEPFVGEALRVCQVGRGEHVGGRALLDLDGKRLAAGDRDDHVDAGVRGLEVSFEVAEHVGQRRRGEDYYGRRPVVPLPVAHRQRRCRA